MELIELVLPLSHLKEGERARYLSFIILTILSLLAGYKVANYCGYYHSGLTDFGINEVIQFFLSGEVLVVIIFTLIGMGLVFYLSGIVCELLALLISITIYPTMKYFIVWVMKKRGHPQPTLLNVYLNLMINIKVYEVKDELLYKGKRYKNLQEIVNSLINDNGKKTFNVQLLLVSIVVALAVLLRLYHVHLPMPLFLSINLIAGYLLVNLTVIFFLDKISDDIVNAFHSFRCAYR